MKIVSTPPPEEFEYKFKCSCCKSVLVASVDDVRYDDFRGYADNFADMRFYTTCPVCGNDRIIPDNKISQIVQIKIRSKRS